MAFLLTSQGLSLYTIPIAWVLSLLPHFYAIKVYEAASLKKFDLTQPRSLTGTIGSDQSLSKATKDVCLSQPLPLFSLYYQQDGAMSCLIEHDKHDHISIHLRHMIQTSNANHLTLETIVRAEGAQQTGFENLGIFAAGVIAGNAAGLGIILCTSIIRA